MDLGRRMLEAAMAGDVAEVQALLAADPHLAASCGCCRCTGAIYSALYLAAENGHREVARLLVEAGAPLGEPAAPGEWSPLAIALAAGHDELAQDLLAHGAPRDVWAAAALGDLARVQALVAAQPERLAGRGPDGAQPLHFARSVELAHWLVAQGADPLARDTVHANTPARWAAADSRRPEVAEYLLRFDPETELFLACAQGDAARAARVLDAAPELVNALGTPRDLLCSGTPLHCAIERGDEALADLLLARGADPGARSAWGHYPLHSAVMRGRLACVELLLAHGARPAVRDRCRGLTPREWALRYRRDDLADLLAAAEQA